MADNPSIDPGATPSIPVEGDDIGAGVIRQGVVVSFGAKDASSRVTPGNPLPTVDATSNASLGTTADTAYTTGSGSIIAVLKGIYTKLSASIAVTGTFWQATQPVSAASLPLPTGAATETTQSGQSTLIGAVTEAAPATDTASSGLNGRLQRIAQRLTSLIGVLPTALGANGGLKIEGVASGTAVPISGTVTSTPSGTQTISGTVTANAGTGPFPVSDNAGSLTVDAPVGTPVFARLSDGTTALTTTSGRLAVDPSGVTSPVSAASLPLPTGAATAAGVASVVTALGTPMQQTGGSVAATEALVDNAAFTDGTSKVIPAGYVLDETAGTALTENDIAAGRIDSKRAQVGVIEDATTRGQRAAVSSAGALSVAVVSNTAVVTDGGGQDWQEIANGYLVGGVPQAVDSSHPLPVTDAKLPAALGAHGGLVIEGVASGTTVPVSATSLPITQTPASAETSTVYSGTTALTPKTAFANVAASQTDSSIVAAVASKKIRVLCAIAVAGGTATTLTFNSKPAGAGTAISPLLANGANGGEILPFSPVGWFETNAGEGLTVTTGAGSATGILVRYVEV